MPRRLASKLGASSYGFLATQFLDYMDVRSDGPFSSQGIVNIFIVLPQFLMIAVSSVIFAILEPGRSVLHGGNAVGGCTASGGEGPECNGAEPPTNRIDALGLIFRCVHLPLPFILLSKHILTLRLGSAEFSSF